MVHRQGKRKPRAKVRPLVRSCWCQFPTSTRRATLVESVQCYVPERRLRTPNAGVSALASPKQSHRLETLLLGDSVLGLVMGSQASRERAHRSPGLQVASRCHGGDVNCSQVHFKDGQTVSELLIWLQGVPILSLSQGAISVTGLGPQEEPRCSIIHAAHELTVILWTLHNQDHVAHTAELSGQKIASIASLIRRCLPLSRSTLS